MSAATITATAVSIIESPLVSIIGALVPEAAPIIAILQRFAPVVAAAEPAIAEAVTAGMPVFEAAVAAAPKFGSLIAQIMHQLPTPFDEMPNSDVVIENVSRAIGGFGRMTPEQEKRWMDLATPGNDPSQENSKFTVG